MCYIPIACVQCVYDVRVCSVSIASSMSNHNRNRDINNSIRRRGQQQYYKTSSSLDNSNHKHDSHRNIVISYAQLRHMLSATDERLRQRARAVLAAPALERAVLFARARIRSRVIELIRRWRWCRRRGRCRCIARQQRRCYTGKVCYNADPEQWQRCVAVATMPGRVLR